MSDFDVLGDTAVSHLPNPIASSLDQQQHNPHHHQRPTLVTNEISAAYAPSQTSFAFAEITNRIKQESQIQDNPIALDQQSQHLSFHPQPTTSATGISSYQLSSASSQCSPLSQSQSHYHHLPTTTSSLPPLNQLTHSFSENPLPPTPSHFYHQGTLENHSNKFSPLKSPSLPLPPFPSSHQSHQQPQNNLHFYPASSLYSPSNFNPEPLFPDHLQSSPNWPDSPNGHPFDLRHRNISLSTPISTTRSFSTPDNANKYQFNRLPNLPTYHSVEPSDQVPCSSMETSYPHLSSLGLPNLDCHYTFNAQPHPSAFIQPNPRKVLQSMNNSYHPGHPDYFSGSSPSTMTPRFDPSTRSSHSPPDSCPSSLPRYLSPPASQPPIGQKRKLDAECYGSPKPQRPSPIPGHSKELAIPTLGLESGHPRMTTVLCFHASVAQKSYGQEKRFLCPPPLVRITGPYRQLPKPHRPILSMSILNEDGSTHLCQTALLGEDNSNVHFKSLHISGAAKKAKHINLELSLHPPLSHGPQPHYHLIPEIEDLLPPFATFRSSDCNVISKPSKKTAKARNTQSCIFNGSTICLFNRINSQTVRTKYLCIQDGQLAARAAQWSAFMIRVVRRAEDPGADGTPPLTAKTLLSSSIPGADRTVTYGSEVELVDFVTGVSSGPLVVRKVEKNTVQKDATGPVSQMQKLAFCQVDKTNGSAQYISALEGMNLATGSINPFDPVSEDNPSAPNQDKSDVNGVSLDSAFAPVGALPVQSPPMLHMLQLQSPRAILPPEEPEGTPLDEIDDSVAWTVIGVAHFSHSFIDLSHQYPQIPQIPITPFPALICRPKVDLHALTMSLRVAGFFDAHNQPMEVWLGPIGALATKVLETIGMNVESHKVDGELKDDLGLQGTSLHLPLQATHDWPAFNRTGVRQESTLLISLPSLESIHWTLHQKNMPTRSMVVLDESNRSMSELVGRDNDAKNNNNNTNNNNNINGHIPALPITLIRADGMSFVMGHSICLSQVAQLDDQKENHELSQNPLDLQDRSHTLVLKVI